MGEWAGCQAVWTRRKRDHLGQGSSEQQKTSVVLWEDKTDK